MRLIGLTGQAGSGKDTVARIISQNMDSCQTFAFSDPLYQEVAYAWGVSEYSLANRHHKEQPWLHLKDCNEPQFVHCIRELSLVDSGDAWLSPRQALQWWGTQYRRAQDMNYWIKKASTHIDRVRRDRDCEFLVCTDVRFLNEAQLIFDASGVIWRVNRPDTKSVNKHISETPMRSELVDWEIFNRSTLEELESQVRQALRYL